MTGVQTCALPISQNKSVYKNSKLGTGVRLVNGRYFAVIGVAKKRVRKGPFQSAEEASQAYKTMKRELHNFI